MYRKEIPQELWATPRGQALLPSKGGRVSGDIQAATRIAKDGRGAPIQSYAVLWACAA